MSAAKVCVEVGTARTPPATAYIEAATAHMVNAIAQTAPSTIKPPFEPTTAAHEKMAKSFVTFDVLFFFPPVTHFIPIVLNRNTY